MENTHKNVTDLGLSVTCLVDAAYRTKDAKLFDRLMFSAQQVQERQGNMIGLLRAKGVPK